MIFPPFELDLAVNHHRDEEVDIPAITDIPTPGPMDETQPHQAPSLVLLNGGPPFRTGDAAGTAPFTPESPYLPLSPREGVVWVNNRIFASRSRVTVQGEEGKQMREGEKKKGTSEPNDDLKYLEQRLQISKANAPREFDPERLGRISLSPALNHLVRCLYENLCLNGVERYDCCRTREERARERREETTKDHYQDKVNKAEAEVLYQNIPVSQVSSSDGAIPLSSPLDRGDLAMSEGEVPLDEEGEVPLDDTLSDNLGIGSTAESIEVLEDLAEKQITPTPSQITVFPARKKRLSAKTLESYYKFERENVTSYQEETGMKLYNNHTFGNYDASTRKKIFSSIDSVLTIFGESLNNLEKFSAAKNVIYPLKFPSSASSIFKFGSPFHSPFNIFSRNASRKQLNISAVNKPNQEGNHGMNLRTTPLDTRRQYAPCNNLNHVNKPRDLNHVTKPRDLTHVTTKNTLSPPRRLYTPSYIPASFSPIVTSTPTYQSLDVSPVTCTSNSSSNNFTSAQISGSRGSDPDHPDGPRFQTSDTGGPRYSTSDTGGPRCPALKSPFVNHLPDFHDNHNLHNLTLIDEGVLFTALRDPRRTTPAREGDEVLGVISNCEERDVLLGTLLNVDVGQLEKRLLFYFRHIANVGYCYDIVEKVGLQRVNIIINNHYY